MDNDLSFGEYYKKMFRKKVDSVNIWGYLLFFAFGWGMAFLTHTFTFNMVDWSAWPLHSMIIGYSATPAVIGGLTVITAESRGWI